MEQPQENQNAIINNLDTRLRIIEGKYNLTRERLLSVNQNTIDHYKKITLDIKLINDDVKEIKENLSSLKKTIKNLIKELNLFARKDQVRVLEKYINLWNPLNFITEEEVLELIAKNKIKSANGIK
jgi:hypothetical protein